MKDIIMAAITTLEQVEVKGSENMSRLLGTINALRSLVEKEDADGNTSE